MIDEKLLWDALKRQKEENAINLTDPAVNCHFGAGINQAIRLLNLAPKIKCGTCRWHDDFFGACYNGESPYRADFTSTEQFCDKWSQENK